jgi:hypothetical protein
MQPVREIKWKKPTHWLWVPQDIFRDMIGVDVSIACPGKELNWSTRPINLFIEDLNGTVDVYKFQHM